MVSMVFILVYIFDHGIQNLGNDIPKKICNRIFGRQIIPIIMKVPRQRLRVSDRLIVESRIVIP